MKLKQNKLIYKQRKYSIDRSKYGNFIIQLGNFNVTALMLYFFHKKKDSGKSFGELALINDDSSRNATIITDEKCDFLVVDRALYERTLKVSLRKTFRNLFIKCNSVSESKPICYNEELNTSYKNRQNHQEAELNDRRAFVNKHILFKKWPSRLKNLLIMSLIKESHQFDSCIVEQGQKLNGLIFLKK